MKNMKTRDNQKNTNNSNGSTPHVENSTVNKNIRIDRAKRERR